VKDGLADLLLTMINSWSRIQVGQDRVVIDDLGRVIMVIDAGPRGSIYQR
jgi:mRNA interferase RelE/StbE